MFTLKKNNEYSKTISNNLNHTNWKIFRSTVNIFQKNINEYLTTLVEAEKSFEDQTGHDDKDLSGSEDEETSPKRSLGSPNLGGRKCSKIS